MPTMTILNKKKPKSNSASTFLLQIYLFLYSMNPPWDNQDNSVIDLNSLIVKTHNYWLSSK